MLINNIDDNFWRELDKLCQMWHKHQDEVHNGQKYMIEEIIRSRAEVSEYCTLTGTAELVVRELYNHHTVGENNNDFVDAVEILLWGYTDHD